MNFKDLVQQRYSCRNYAPKEISNEQLDYIMECVRLSPSAVNRQPWKFYIISNDIERVKLQKCYHQEWFATAPIYVIATIRHDQEWVRADGKAHGNIDIAIAVEHLCLAATELGLGTCWVCNFDVQLCQSLFNLGEQEEPAVLIPLGYPAEAPKQKNRKEADEIIRFI